MFLLQATIGMIDLLLY